MRRSIAAYLADIIDACDHIVEVTDPLDASAYLADKTIRRAVERDFQIIGEALAQLRDRRPEVFAQIEDGSAIIGFRNILVHQYFDLDHRTVWDTITHDVKPLHVLAVRVLSQSGESVNE